jgi:hypothetical protein
MGNYLQELFCHTPKNSLCPTRGRGHNGATDRNITRLPITGRNFVKV